MNQSERGDAQSETRRGGMGKDGMSVVGGGSGSGDNGGGGKAKNGRVLLLVV